MKRIAFLGPEGTFSQESLKHFLAGAPYELVPYPLISDIYMAAAKGETDYGVVPIENTIDSAVSLHLDWLVHEVDLPIQAEWVYPAVQNLIGYRLAERAGEATDEELGRIRKIYSIPVAIAQCTQFLRSRMPHAAFEHAASTAAGVRAVKEMGDPSCAAIGTKLAAAHYGLDVLQAGINDHDNNYTRFILVGHERPADLRPAAMTKTTILVTLPEDYPGALHQVLSAFAWRRINLSKIESRPTRKRLGSYYFYIDAEASLDSVLLPAAIAEIEAIGCQVRILGSYPSYSYDSANSEV